MKLGSKSFWKIQFINLIQFLGICLLSFLFFYAMGELWFHAKGW